MELNGIILIFAAGIGVFTLVVMWTVFQAAIEAKDYFARMNREYYDADDDR